MDTQVFVREKIKSIAAKEMAVFCGAGISMHSGLPLANSLVRCLLEKLNFSHQEADIIINSALPFEAFMETLAVETDIDNLLSIFEDGEPNTNHVLLAKLAKDGYLKTICTTNFDRLIEKAFQQEGLTAGTDYEVFYKEDGFDKIDWDDDKVHLVKIHGSVEDKRSIAITLNQVANRSLSAQRQAVVKEVFSKGKHKIVLVLGYSCSDVFDISLHIEAITDPYKEVVFVEHYPTHENSSKDNWQIEDITTKKIKNPFQHYKGSTRIFYDTGSLVEQIWASTVKEEYPTNQNTNQPLWRTRVDEWLSAIDKDYAEAIKFGVGGLLFFRVAEFRRALSYFERALALAKGARHEPGEAGLLIKMGNNLRILGDSRKAKKCYEDALQIARRAGDRVVCGRAIGALGNLYFNIGEPDKAIPYHLQSVQIARENGDKREEGLILSNLGNAYGSMGDYENAKRYFEQGLQIARDTGDKQGEESRLGNLGIVYQCLGKLWEAIECHEEALRITKEIGDRQGEATQIGNLGNVYLSLEFYRKAIDQYKEALRIYEEIEDRQGIARITGNLGGAYYKTREYNIAIKYSEQSQQLAIDIGDKQVETNALNNLAISCGILGDLEKALEYLKRKLVVVTLMYGNDHPAKKDVERTIETVKGMLH